MGKILFILNFTLLFLKLIFAITFTFLFAVTFAIAVDFFTNTHVKVSHISFTNIQDFLLIESVINIICIKRKLLSHWLNISLRLLMLNLRMFKTTIVVVRLYYNI
jgi:hypothetical protein